MKARSKKKYQSRRHIRKRPQFGAGMQKYAEWGMATSSGGMTRRHDG